MVMIMMWVKKVIVLLSQRVSDKKAFYSEPITHRRNGSEIQLRKHTLTGFIKFEIFISFLISISSLIVYSNLSYYLLTGKK